MTKHRMLKMRVTIDDNCLLCGDQAERVNHLFFQSKFSQVCIRKVLEWLQITSRNQEINGWT